MSNSLSYADKIQIVPYNPNWPKLAEEEISSIKNILPYNWVIDIQHIGSTAIIGLVAKPIIDICIGVTSIQKAQKSIRSIEKLGYQFWPENPNKEKMFFVKGMPPFGKQRTHHIHIVEHSSDYWKATIRFRDYLLSHQEEAHKYAHLKRKLVQEHFLDREAYTNAKTQFITLILEKAGFNRVW